MRIGDRQLLDISFSRPKLLKPSRIAHAGALSGRSLTVAPVPGPPRLAQRTAECEQPSRVIGT